MLYWSGCVDFFQFYTQGLSHALIPSSNPSRSHSRGIPIHHSRNIRSEHRPLVGASVLQLARGVRPRLSFSFHTSPCTRGNHIYYSRDGVRAGRLFYDDGGDDRSWHPTVLAALWHVHTPNVHNEHQPLDLRQVVVVGQAQRLARTQGNICSGQREGETATEAS